MQLGSVTFSIAPINTHEYSVTSATDYAQKAIVGTRQPYEFVGEGDQKMQISGKLLPKHVGGLNEMAAIHVMRQSGSPQFVVRGDGRPFGWFIIESIEEKSANLAIDGIGHEIEFTVSLCRADKPVVADFSYSLYGLDL